VEGVGFDCPLCRPFFIHIDPTPVPLSLVPQTPSILRHTALPTHLQHVEGVGFDCPLCRPTAAPIQDLLKGGGQRVAVGARHGPKDVLQLVLEQQRA
jgi:hypothetical protein